MPVVLTSMRKNTFVALSLLFTASAASADIFGCDETAPRRATLSAAGASRIVVIGRAGSLKVRGQRGSEVVASGTACASDKALLDEIQLTATRRGTEIEVEAVIPERKGFFGNASLDFEVALPSNVPIVVKDGSGSLRVSDVASLEITDGSGGMEVHNVGGNLKVRDGSGEMRIEDVSGDVVIVDGSGSIDIRGVQRSVRIAADGSGGIDVSDVRGDFIVERDGSGGVDYARVAGRVSIPRKD
jgi:hypothetical protein